MLVGPHSTAAAARRIRAPRYRPTRATIIAQPTLALSRVPTIVDDHFEGRHVDLRPYVLCGKDIYVLPGGLTRVAMRKVRWWSTRRRGAAAKIPGSWRRRQPSGRRSTAIAMPHTRPLLSRVADAVYWMGRYIERAENVARFIDVNHNLMLDLPQDYAGPVAAHRRYHRRPRACSRNATARPREKCRALSGVRSGEPQFDLFLHPGGARKCAHRCARPFRRKCGSRSTASTCMITAESATAARRTLPEFCHQVRMGCHLFHGITARAP